MSVPPWARRTSASTESSRLIAPADDQQRRRDLDEDGPRRRGVPEAAGVGDARPAARQPARRGRRRGRSRRVLSRMT